MTYQTGKRPRLGCAALALILSVAAVVFTPIGPIYVYGWLVPIIGPVIPKPEDVPSRAEAEYHWKGFGLIWYWEEEVTGGCARWWAAESSDEPVRGLTVFEGGKSCEDGERVMYRLSFEDHTTFGSGGNEWPYEKCPFNLSEASVSRYFAHITELKRTNSATIQRGMLERMQSEIEQIDLLGLRAQQHGCRLEQG
ncbi:hypothetical protein N8940_02200 [Sphingomonadaceae bacterium]|nr:hypothetical protein [Sphingomonadaceae bacterium]